MEKIFFRELLGNSIVLNEQAEQKAVNLQHKIRSQKNEN